MLPLFSMYHAGGARRAKVRLPEGLCPGQVNALAGRAVGRSCPEGPTGSGSDCRSLSQVDYRSWCFVWWMKSRQGSEPGSGHEILFYFADKLLVFVAFSPSRGTCLFCFHGLIIGFRGMDSPVRDTILVLFHR